MSKITNSSIDLEKSFYSLKRMAFGDTLTLTKNDKAVMIIPEDLKDDFVQILSKVMAYDKMQEDGTNDIPDELFTKHSK